MITNYLLIAFRRLMNQKAYSLITVLGLSVGIACALIVGHYAIHELRFDRFHTHADRTYRVIVKSSSHSVEAQSINTPGLLHDALRSSLPECEASALIVKDLQGVFLYGEKQFHEGSFYLADGDFFKTFDFEWVKGSPEGVLSDPRNIVVTEEFARRYFGEEDPMQKQMTFTLEETMECVVAGVVKSLPEYSHFKPDVIAPVSFLFNQALLREGWNLFLGPTYVRLKDGSDIQSLNKKIASLIQPHFKGEVITAELQPLTDIHLNSHYGAELEANGNKTIVYTIISIGCVILLLACINYINLSTARSSIRSKEIGLRKVLGSMRNQVLAQFLLESLFMALIAACLALLFIQLSSPVLYSILGIRLDLLESGFTLVLGAVGISLLTGLLAGIYPGTFLSSFKPINALKGIVHAEGYRFSVRRSLVVVQFVISFGLILSVVIMTEQLDFIQNKNLGFETDKLVFVRTPQKPIDRVNMANFKPLTDAISNVAGVEAITGIGRIPGYSPFDAGRYWISGTDPSTAVEGAMNGASANFTSVFKVKLVAGRDFTDLEAAERRGTVLINETAARHFGLSPEDAIGKVITTDAMMGRTINRTIVGVLADFHFESVHSPIRPLIIFPNSYPTHHAIRLQTTNLPATVQAIEREWRKVVPDWPMELFILKDQLVQVYSRDITFVQSAKYLAIIAIILSLLGIFGLANFHAEQKEKEMAVRKIMGASSTSLFLLSIRTFALHLLLAFAVAVPLTIAFTDEWLSAFSYRVGLNWMIVLATGVGLTAVSLVSVTIQLAKLSRVNPAQSLRVSE